MALALWVVVGVFVLIVAFKLLSPWLGLTLIRLRPSRVAPLAAADVPRYFEQLADVQRQRLEALGFRVAGYFDAQEVTFEFSPSAPVIVLRNDLTRTLAFLRVNEPFAPERTMRVTFNTSLTDGKQFVTSDDPIGAIGVPPEHYHSSRALDDEAIYREHLDRLEKSGLQAVDPPPSIQEIVLLEARDSERNWQANVDSGWHLAAENDSFRFAPWKLLRQMASLSGRITNAPEITRRRREFERKKPGGAVVSSPEIDLFLRQQQSFRKAATEAVLNRRNRSPSYQWVMRIILVAAGVVAFIVTWRFLSRPR